MDTRHVVFVYYQGRFVLAQYGQFDGYPEAEGAVILEFIQTPGNIDRLKNGLDFIYMPSKNDLAGIHREIKEVVSETNKSTDTVQPLNYDIVVKSLFPSLSILMCGEILEIVAQATAEKRVPVSLNPHLIYDDWCEWAYVVDLDAEVFEVYCFAERELAMSSRRFKGMEGQEPHDSVPKMATSFGFAELPATEAEFLAALAHVYN